MALFSVSIFNSSVFNTGGVSPTPTPTPSEEPTLGGTKRRVRGPYSDPRIFEEYLKRCIAEREAPRANVEIAVLKEALIDAVEDREQSDNLELDALRNENQILARLVSLEKAKRNVAALVARQRQLERQIAQMEEDEASMLLALFNALED